jgi:hypothetical protein
MDQKFNKLAAGIAEGAQRGVQWSGWADGECARLFFIASVGNLLAQKSGHVCPGWCVDKLRYREGGLRSKLAKKPYSVGRKWWRRVFKRADSRWM